MLRAERGSVSATVAVFMTVLLGMMGLALDVGRLYLERQHIQSVADATVLSAVSQLPGSPSGAVTMAQQYLQKNGIDPAAATITVAPDHHHMTVALAKNVPMTFAQVLGIRQENVSGGSTGWTGNLSGAAGIVPLGVPASSWTVGESVDLKLSPHDGYVAPGDYQALALGNSGASDYQQNFMYGYSGFIRAGDWLDTKPGNMAGPTIAAVNFRVNQDPYATWNTVKKGSARLVTAPILEDYEVNGRGEVHVVGFGVFFLEQAIDKGNDKGEVIGRFLRTVSEGETSETAGDYGVYVTKLSN
ncbi:MAG TPA: pilus assembly protein TadG-related protein [Symbiobacteriaceae bacterium]|jgi:hypothetical protein